MVSDDKEALLRAEAEQAAAIEHFVSTLTQEEAEEPTLNEDGWSVKDAVYHIAYWQSLGAAATADRTGSYAGSDEELDQENEGVLTASSTVSWASALDEWNLARGRAREAFGAIEAPSESDIEWFTEEGIDHMATHLAEMVAWKSRR
jgi:hypothetical protein